MASASALELPPPRNWQDFEDLCCDLWRRVWGDPDAQKVGRLGQSQQGVDIFGRPNRGPHWAGIQCRLRGWPTKRGFGPHELRAAVEQASTFKPPVSSLTIATTAPRDANAQAVAREITQHGPISLAIASWQDISEILAAYPELISKHFPQFRDNELRQRSRISLRERRKLTADQKSLSDPEPILESTRHVLDQLASESAVRTQIFFDTIDVYRMIFGFEALSEERGLTTHFWSKGALVSCIAFAGWYPPIQLLPPHQVELLRLLGLRFEEPFIGREGYASKMQTFLNAVGADDLRPFALNFSRTYSSSDLKELVRKFAGRAETLFRIVQCIRDGEPHSRLQSLRNRKVIAMTGADGQIGLDHILGLEEFHELHRVLTELRPQRTVSNFSDALALGYLILALQEFDRRDSDRLPLFFASSKLFDIAVQAAGLEELFVPSRLGEVGSILRGPEYFVFRAVFCSPLSKGRDSGHQEVLERLRSNLAMIIDARTSGIVGAELVGTQVEAIVQDLRTFSLFENVWLPVFAEEEAQRLMDFSAALGEFEDQELRRTLREQIEKTKESFEYQVGNYSLASKLLAGLERVAARRRVLDGLEERVKALKHFGFSPSSVQLAIELSEEIAGGTCSARNSGFAVIKGILGREREVQTDSLVGLGVLWILDLHEQIVASVQAWRSRGTEADLQGLALVMEVAGLTALDERTSALELLEVLEARYGVERANAARSVLGHRLSPRSPSAPGGISEVEERQP